MDDAAARRAREIVHRYYYNNATLQQIENAVAAAFRKLEAERDTAKFAWQQVQPALDAARERERSLAARLARVERALAPLGHQAALLNGRGRFYPQCEHTIYLRTETLQEILAALTPDAAREPGESQ